MLQTFPRRALAVLGTTAAIAAAAASPAGASDAVAPSQTPVTVPANGLLTVPVPCDHGVTPSVRVLATTVTGRCTGTGAAQFRLSEGVRHALAEEVSPATVTAGRTAVTLRLGGGVRALTSAVSGFWTDATLDCFPLGGGIMGGGTYNNSVHLTLNWHSTGATFVARHWAFYEEYWDGSGPYLRNTNGRIANRSPVTGPFHVTRDGVSEWMTSVPTWGFNGSITQLNPWSDEQAYVKSHHVMVRARVALQRWNGYGWNAPRWHFANPRGGYSNGFCSL